MHRPTALTLMGVCLAVAACGSGPPSPGSQPPAPAPSAIAQVNDALGLSFAIVVDADGVPVIVRK